MLKDAFKMLSLMWKKITGTYIWPSKKRVPHLRIQSTADWKYSGKKIPEKSNKQNLSLLHALATVYTAFTLYYQTKSRNDLQNTGGCT